MTELNLQGACRRPPRGVGGLLRRRRAFRLAHALGLALGLWLVLGAGSRRAWAYPQWQLSTGSVRCAQCHFSPGGGGLINNFGRDAISDEQTTFGGDGGLFHGGAQLPPWLAFGGDFRGAYVAEDVHDVNGTKQAVFPMQADVQARVAISDFSFYASGGLRAQVRENEALVPDQNYQPISTSRLISREHYLMWRRGSTGPYARVGRFYAPFGLRMGEHVLYVRRDLGFNQLEESYNLSFGHLGETSEVHITAFAPDFVRHIGGRSSGIAVYAEQRLADDAALIGGQAKLDVEGGNTRVIGGLVGKGFVANLKTLFFAEADAVRLITGGGDSTQFVGLAGGSLLPANGLMLTLLGERRQTDLRVSGTATNAAAFMVNWFPYAHVELEVFARIQAPSGGDTAKTLLLQLHYIL